MIATHSNNFIPVTKAKPCEVCGKPDWCRKSDDGCIECRRVAMETADYAFLGSTSGGAGLFRRRDELNGHHANGNGQSSSGKTFPKANRDESKRVTVQAAEAVRDALPPAPRSMVLDLAKELGVSEQSLIEVGIVQVDNVPAFPERNADGEVAGYCRRMKDGKKRVRPGDSRGVIVPTNLADLPDPVLVVEGASDVAACLTLGLAAIGRPNNVGGGDEIAEICEGRKVVVVGEWDAKPDGKWPGREGAERVAQQLANAWGTKVAYSMPPSDAKDVREWLKQHGAESGQEFVKALRENNVTLDPKADGEQEALKRIRTVRLSDVEPKAVEWLYHNHLQRRAINLLISPPGDGKTFIAVDWAARVSAGRAFPFEFDAARQPANVIMLLVEDDLGDTIRPRFDVAQGDPENVHIVQAVAETKEGSERIFNLSRDVRLLDDMIEKIGNVEMVVVDPLGAYLGGVDTHKHSDVYDGLSALATMAQERGVCVLALHHTNKTADKRAMNRIMGSQAFAALCRQAWTILPHPESENPRDKIVAHAKANACPMQPAMPYRIETAPGGIGFVSWASETLDMTADQAIEVTDSRGTNDDKSALDTAIEWVRETLANGPVDSKEFDKKADIEGIATRTLKRARSELGVKAEQVRESGKVTGWTVCIPVK